jgi:hypothetical protein
MRTVHIMVKSHLVLKMDEGVEVQQVMDELESTMISRTPGAEVMDDAIIDHEVTDSK